MVKSLQFRHRCEALLPDPQAGSSVWQIYAGSNPLQIIE